MTAELIDGYNLIYSKAIPVNKFIGCPLRFDGSTITNANKIINFQCDNCANKFVITEITP